MMKYSNLEILERVCVENYDNGRRFLVPIRLEAIRALLEGGSYRCVKTGDLFHLYGRREPIRGDRILLVSSHVDCHPAITRCSSRQMPGGLLHGTYDNAITNAAAVSVMLRNDLPDSVFFAFTGDEEFRSRGAAGLAAFLRQLDVEYECIVLDVTDLGWEEQADFTIENDLWGLDTGFGEKLISLAEETGFRWRFVPADPENIDAWVPTGRVIPEEAEEDESWEYDEQDIECVSLCLPCCGEMHDNQGVDVREAGYERYIRTLHFLLNGLCGE